MFEFNAREGSSEIGCMILRRSPGRLRQIRKVGRLFPARFFVTFCHRPPPERIIFRAREPTGLSACIGSVADAASDRNPTRSVRCSFHSIRRHCRVRGLSSAKELRATCFLRTVVNAVRLEELGCTVLRRYLLASPSSWKDECGEGTRSTVRRSRRTRITRTSEI